MSGSHSSSGHFSFSTSSSSGDHATWQMIFWALFVFERIGYDMLFGNPTCCLGGLWPWQHSYMLIHVVYILAAMPRAQ